ncbi:helix-turn-helix domain-containing protein [Massilicoli timonensis]|uniref:helix-turn-helix domain-containing protein n=1 Tax=Massilicoli timonensis TaxID=2015901 RepID=UPI000C8183DC|nr:helix-turn-helix transcriptional regulator [Massilicoli timonensis]
MKITLTLADIMKKKGVIPAELARKSGISPSAINHIYWQLGKHINLEYLAKICKALNCSVSDILTISK